MKIDLRELPKSDLELLCGFEIKIKNLVKTSRKLGFSQLLSLDAWIEFLMVALFLGGTFSSRMIFNIIFGCPECVLVFLAPKSSLLWLIKFWVKKTSNMISKCFIESGILNLVKMHIWFVFTGFLTNFENWFCDFHIGWL